MSRSQLIFLLDTPPAKLINPRICSPLRIRLCGSTFSFFPCTGQLAYPQPLAPVIPQEDDSFVEVPGFLHYPPPNEGSLLSPEVEGVDCADEVGPMNA